MNLKENSATRGAAGGINLLNNVFRLPLYTISDRVRRLQWKLYLNVPAQRISREGGYLDMIFQHEEKNTFGCSQISQSLLQRVMTSMDHNVGDAGDFFFWEGETTLCDILDLQNEDPGSKDTGEYVSTLHIDVCHLCRRFRVCSHCCDT